MGKSDCSIPELEKELEKAKKLKKKIDNPEPERLLSTHRQLEEEYRQLMSGKILLYIAAKEVIEKEFGLFHLTDKNELAYLMNFSPAGHPELCYADKFGFSSPIATFIGRPMVRLSPKEFMTKLMAGDYKPLDNICLNCKSLVPFGNTSCPKCGKNL